MATAIPANRAPFTVEEVAAVTRGSIVRRGAPSVGVFTDSRALTEGSAFVALTGERFDGHGFLEAAAAKGARMLVVSRDDDRSPEVGIVRVADTRRALGDMARAHRERWGRAAPRSLVAITGSAGKTTTKTVLARLLDTALPGSVHASAGNLNNDIGVPMTLFGLEDAHRFAVVEVGTSGPGEIERLAAIAMPDVSVLTLVAAAHTAGLGSVDEVAREKGALLGALAPSGLGVANGDDPRALAELRRSGARNAKTYGFSNGADYRIVLREALGIAGSHLRIERSGSAIEADSPLLGDAGALAVAASLAVVEWLLGRRMTGDELGRALSGALSGGEGRLAPSVLGDGTWLIDDSYNANPASMRSSIAVAIELAGREGRRVVLVLGEMRELGALSVDEHVLLGRYAAERGVALVIGVGGDARLIANEVERAGKRSAFAVDADQAIPLVSTGVAPRDVVLVKGSRSIGTEKIVRALREARGATPA